MEWGIPRDTISSASDLAAKFRHSRFFSACALEDSNAGIPITTRTSPDSDIKRELSGGRLMVITKTDCIHCYCAVASKQTSYFYNHPSSQLVGNFEKRESAQPVKGWRLTTFETILDAYAILIEDGLETVDRWDLPIALGRVYAWFHLGIKESGKLALEIPPLPTDKPRSPSRE